MYFSANGGMVPQCLEMKRTLTQISEIRNPYFISQARTFVSPRPAADAGSYDRFYVSIQAS